MHIKIFYKCDCSWRIAEWKQYIDRSDVTACVSGSLVLSGLDSVVLGNSGLSSARARSGCAFLIWFWILLSLTKGIFIFGSKVLVIKKNLGICVLRWWFYVHVDVCNLSTAAYSVLMPGSWECYMSLTFSGISTQATFLNVLAHLLCSSVGDDKEIKISCLIIWSKWIFFILR